MYEVEVRHIDAAPMVYVGASTPKENLSDAIRNSLGILWDRVRSEKIEGVGRNLIIYDDFRDGLLHIRAGIELGPDHALPDAETGWSPCGTVAISIHKGDYSGIPNAHEAIVHYCAERGLELDKVSWEIYGHWTDDPNQLTTEVCYLLQE